MTHIYLDYNASAPLRREAKHAMMAIMEYVGNASSIHGYGRRVRQQLEEGRQHIADYFGIPSSRVIFTSGATEANNLALKGFRGTVIASAVDHDSVIKARPDALICPVNESGVILLDRLEELVLHAEKPVLISIMAANNETGVIQPIEAIRDLCTTYGAWFHCDAAQAIGRLTLPWSKIECDMISLSGHKIGGPSGVGALIIHEKLPLHPLIRGGGQERSFRSGTENVVGIVGFGAALKACQTDNWCGVEKNRDDLEKSLSEICPELKIFGQDVNRLPNTSNLTMPGVKSTVQLMNFDLSGIAVSAGSACSSGKVKSSHVLKAMNVRDEEAESSIRISLGCDTKAEEIHRFIAVWQELYHRLGTPAVRRTTP